MADAQIFSKPPKYGSFTATSGTPKVVYDAAVSANSIIVLTVNTPGGAQAGSTYVSAKSAGVSFTVINGAGTDTSVYNYAIFN